MKSSPTNIIRPGVICRSGEINNWEERLGFFRIFYINGGEYNYTAPLRFCDNPTDSFEEFHLNVTLEYLKPNNGTSENNEIVIVSSFPVDLPRCKIQFVMKKGKYRITGGTIQQSYSTKDLTVVDVLTNVNSNGKKVVNICKF